MRPVIAPPSLPAPGTAEALFAEARRRRRRRRFTAAAVILVLAASAAAVFTATRPHPAVVAREAGRARAGTAVGPVAGLVAWVDYYGYLHQGNLATLAQRVVATTSANAAGSLVQAGGHLYWVNSPGAFAQEPAHGPQGVQELDLATGKIRTVAPGTNWDGPFLSGDGRHLFIAATGTRLIELPAGGAGRSRALTLPHGWYLSDALSPGVAGGVLVQSHRTAWPRTVIAVWNPKSGALKVIGKGMEILATYTPPGGQDSLLAWQPAACTWSQNQNCPLEITSTATLSTRTVRSPRHGFALVAGFSPGGTQLAVFAYTSPFDPSGVQPAGVQLGMVSTGTGALRLSGSFGLPAGGCPPAWAQWLPDGRHLIIGGMQASYVVKAATLSMRPLYFMRGSDHDIEASQDINYSTVVVPARR